MTLINTQVQPFKTQAFVNRKRGAILKQHLLESALGNISHLLTNAQVTINANADYGHVDYVFSTNHEKELEKPILKWLKKEVFQ